MESSKIITFCLCSTNRFAFSITISATWTWRDAGSSKVDAMTSPRIVRCISVTSSGRSSMSKTINVHSGTEAVIECAICCNITVLPVFGADTKRPRCPIPIGAIKSTTRAVKSSEDPFSCSRRILSSGCKGTRFSKSILLLASSGC